MFINTEKHQQFLKLAYEVQKNDSNALVRTKQLLKKILNKKVNRAFNYNIDKYFYSLQKIENIPKTDNQGINIGGRPKILADEQREQVIAWKAEHISNREIAKRLKVSEGTIRNEMKRGI